MWVMYAILERMWLASTATVRRKPGWLPNARRTALRLNREEGLQGLHLRVAKIGFSTRDPARSSIRLWETSRDLSDQDNHDAP
eukprot:7316567-Pyramimonas_sp.AAC.1